MTAIDRFPPTGDASLDEIDECEEQAEKAGEAKADCDREE